MSIATDRDALLCHSGSALVVAYKEANEVRTGGCIAMYCLHASTTASIAEIPAVGDDPAAWCY